MANLTQISVKYVIFQKPETRRVFLSGFGSQYLLGFPGFRVSGNPRAPPYQKWSIIPTVRACRTLYYYTVAKAFEEKKSTSIQHWPLAFRGRQQQRFTAAAADSTTTYIFHVECIMEIGEEKLAKDLGIFQKIQKYQNNKNCSLWN